MHDRLVLVVDDDRDNREGMVQYLDACGFRVIGAESARDALAVARTEVPAAVVLDLEMPGVSGYEVARQLRSVPETRHVRLVAYSACVFESDHERARLAGFDAFIDKPSEPGRVVAVLERLLGIETRTPERPEAAS